MRIFNHNFGFFFLEVTDFFLEDFEVDLTLFVSRYKSSVRAAIEQILDAGEFGIDIEKSDAAECKAHERASCALCFSLIVSSQCSRLFLGFGVR